MIGAVGLSIAQASTQNYWQRGVLVAPSRMQKAFDVAALFYGVHVSFCVGLALRYFMASGRGGAYRALTQSPDRIFPYFIVNVVGISGLFIAAIFAAAISTLDSALTKA